MDDKEFILEQYKIYSEAKESFINRNFSTNRFFFVMSLVMFFAIYLLGILTPSILPIIVAAVLGMAVSIMWWLNMDSYQFLIKIKYAKVLEYLETKLPEQPFNKEFVEFKEAKKNSKSIVFTDFQKTVAVVIFLIFFVVFVVNMLTALTVKTF